MNNTDRDYLDADGKKLFDDLHNEIAKARRKAVKANESTPFDLEPRLIDVVLT